MNEESETEAIKSRIWITSKSRMEAEKRYKVYDYFSHILLCVFSIVLIGISLFSNKFASNIPTDAYTVLLSVSIIVFSVVIFGFGFGKTAVLHRECYLRLQKLNTSRLSNEELEKAYHEIISSYPNHSDFDYERLILTRTLFHPSSLTSPDGSTIVWSGYMLVKFIAFQLVFWLVPVFLIIAIVGSLFWLW